MNPLTTLIIDDDEAFNSVLQRALTRRGHSAISAYGAAEALTMAERHQPDRIVLDLNLAGRGGASDARGDSADRGLHSPPPENP